ncbi:MAG TPA: squalene/phytoene synthase family protein [Allosphingosinicella sp.]|nr:squalene/phytoene synthase family protein [Allosphingosinicella sp.]
MTPDLDPDRVLALSYVPAARRPALEALWRLDVALGAVLAGGREPMISRIKLAWWREALEKLDRERAPAEPVLQALAAHVLPAGVTGAELAELVEAWEVLLSSEPLTPEELALYAAARGRLLFLYSAGLLGGEGPAGAGERWALVDLARHSNEADAEAAIAAARAQPPTERWPVRLRPLGMLAALAARDAEPGGPRWELQGAPARMLRMLRLRLTGR